MIYVASLHDKSFRTYTKTGDGFHQEQMQKLTFDLWKLQRARVLESLAYNACSGSVGLSYILNYKDAAYELFLTKTKLQNPNTEYKQIDIYDPDKKYPEDEAGNVIYPSRGIHTKKDYVIDVDESTKKNARFEARMKRNADERGPYAEGQHIALYKDESFTETYEEPAMVDFPDIDRNIIVAYMHAGTCQGFVLGHYSEEDTFTTVGANKYEKYYDGIYIDVICCVVPRGGINMINILKEAWGKKNVTLKSLTPVLTFYSKEDLGFSFGTCKNPLDKNVNDEIVKSLKDAINQRSVHLSEEAKKFDKTFAARYPSDPKNLSKKRKRAFKLLFGNNLADDQNNKLELWAKKGKDKCEFFLPDEKKGEVFAQLNDDQLNNSYMKCGDNGFKMAYCPNEGVIHPKTVRVMPKEPRPQTKKRKSPPRPADTEKKSKKSKKSKRSQSDPEHAYEKLKQEFEREVKARFTKSTPFQDILDAGIPEPNALQIWHVFHQEEPFRVNDEVYAPSKNVYYKAKILTMKGDLCLVHWAGFKKSQDSLVNYSDLRRQMPSS